MKPLNRFFLHVLLWLPICFGAWYYSSILVTAPLAWVLNQVMTGLFPTIIEHVQQYGNHLTIITRLVMEAPNAYGPASGDLLFEVNPLTYSYSIPLYTALLLATPDEESEKMGRWLIGMLVLFAVQVFGLSTSILKTLAFLNEDARGRLGFSPWGYDLVALTYQFGYLILPPVTPIVIWFGQFQRSFGALSGEQSLLQDLGRN
jgi:hypothetical protein